MIWLAVVPLAWMCIALTIGLLVGRCIRVQTGGETAPVPVTATGPTLTVTPSPSADPVLADAP